MRVTNKVKDLDMLAADLQSERRGRRVVHCHGVFDLMHIGHIRHFEDAKKHGDLLVVTLTPDRYVNKGPHRPVFTETLRAETVASLHCVDYVAINHWPTAVETIKLLQPNVYAKGSEYRNASADVTGGIEREREAVESVGGKLIFTDEIVFSSSSLLNQHMSAFPEEVTQYLATFREKYPADVVTAYLKDLSKLKVLVIGEAIIDEYHYCETLGKSGKEPILAAQYLRSETFIGGSLAVANHVAAFAGEVRLVTLVGDENSHEDLIRANLKKNVTGEFLRMPGAPTLVKRRFIETYPFQKLFEIYVMDEQAAERQTDALAAALDRLIPEYDLVVVADYGHGMMNHGPISVVCDKAKRLAVNAQLNAGNHGFNTVSKYRRADFISLSEKEIRVEARDASGNLERIIEDVAGSLSCARVLVTRGAKGNLCYSRSEGFVSAPGFAMKTVDRVGAGDAVFGIGALCAALEVPMEVLGFIGNAVGTEAVGIVGNARFIERAPLLKHIEALLK